MSSEPLLVAYGLAVVQSRPFVRSNVLYNYPRYRRLVHPSSILHRAVHAIPDSRFFQSALRPISAI